MADQKTDSAINDLEKEYLSWKRSGVILKRIHTEALKQEVELPQVKAAMENTIMFLLLHKPYQNADIFKLIDVESLEYGFTCVGLDQISETQLAQMHEIIQQELALENHKTQEIQVEEALKATEKTIGFDDFELKRNAYIDRAYNFLDSQAEAPSEAAIQLLRSALRYASIYSETRHIGPPQEVYDAFYDWGIRNEGFASPFNARLLGKDNAQFYSLFKDTDGILGSGGSFFNLEQPENPGHWSLDPPFLDETMQRVDKTIAQWREKYPEIGILLIVPAHHKPANTPDETVQLKSKKHHYEGLAGTKNPLPVDVNIHRYGPIEAFSAKVIEEGYLP